MEPRAGVEPRAGGAQGAAPMAVDSGPGPADRAGAREDTDDEWEPKVGPGVILRPHLLRWSPAEGSEKTSRAEAVAQLGADPLHDPSADDDDQRWVIERLMQPDLSNVRTTAAVLNCPGCFTPVCYQCQEHERFARQWRAIEVRNCTVDTSARLSLSRDDPVKYSAVRCETCQADVGLMDEDGVYHLFHVIESIA
ncbi:unnamed protein product [Prorocentrum cordatum]|uniref:E2F-associated phosphoprotein n=1 Tax=Prorocentrum cordatum TaxID=2364126 RepID=A0ABN9VZG0_9DINO|nr:unnamed protein product [Polarella glacialis]